MKKVTKNGIGIVCSCFLLHAPVYGADISWSGFGSVVGGKTTNTSKLASGASSTYQVDPTLSGMRDAIYNDKLSFRPDTNFGLQLLANLSDGLAITAQLTSRGGNDFEMEAEWLYVSYSVTPQFIVNAGRQRMPLYLYSDYLDVGFAYHWLRAPIEVYGEGISVYEGISGLYNNYIGDWDYEIQAYVGAGHNETAVIGDTALIDAKGLIATISNDWLKFRASAHGAEGWVDVSALPAPAQLMGEDNPQDFLFKSVGLFIDPGSYFVGAEFTTLEFDEFAQSGSTGVTFDFRESWMVTAGVRIGEFTPHVTLSNRVITLSDHAVPALNDLEQSSETTIVGLRYDFHPKAALKVEYTSAKDTSDDALTAGGKKLEVDVLSAGIDFIF
ncbi:MAG: hypothetical protein COA42_15695 [Alteromonadaceae bacterium]|nr:MAG: hypothetical protein COA42_15695 [Alteromonadaceae bacterium]